VRITIRADGDSVEAGYQLDRITDGLTRGLI
jgi:hypothetical protein